MTASALERPDSDVALYRNDRHPKYPQLVPFHPSELWPEYVFGCRYLGEGNDAYCAVRETLGLLGLDRANFGTSAWNPLKKLVRPGDHVFLKPNMIAHRHQLNDDWEYVITHGSVIRAVVDYVFIALQGEGKITIGDAPQTDSNFEK